MGVIKLSPAPTNDGRAEGSVGVVVIGVVSSVILGTLLIASMMITVSRYALLCSIMIGSPMYGWKSDNL